jgi:outer membrane protein assembly factor BamB
MDGWSRGLAFALVLLGACQQGASALVTQAPSGSAVLPIWERAGLEPFAVVGDAVLAYDRARDGIVEVSSATGEELRFRQIANGPVSGTPGMWVPVNGGYLVSWDERIVFIREQAGALSFGWMVGENSWYTAIGGGDVAWLGKARDESGLYAIDVKDGHTRWAAAFPPDIQGFEMGGDATTIVTSHQEYQHMPPGEHDIHHVFAGYDSATGKRRWRVELADEPRASAVGVGGAVAVTDGAIELYDGTSGALHSVKLASPPYVHVLIDRGLAVIDEDHSHTLSAYEISDGHLVWTVELPPTPTVGVTALSASLAAHGDVLFVAAHGQVHAFARATGKLLWSVQTGADFGRLDVTDAGVVAIDSHAMTGFALPPTAPVLETATIHGVVRDVRCATLSSVWVRVGNARVHPDATGAFRATIQATGRIVVEVPYNKRETTESVTSRTTIQLTGKGDYATPDFVADDCAYDYE